MKQTIQYTLSDNKENKSLNLQSTQLFVTRRFNNKDIKVVLDKNTKVYKQTYKGINFFVYRNIFKTPPGWIAIEMQTGGSIAEGFHTKKETIEYTCGWIDDTERLDELIDTVIDINRSSEIMNVKEYMEYVK